MEKWKSFVNSIILSCYLFFSLGVDLVSLSNYRVLFLYGLFFISLIPLLFKTTISWLGCLGFLGGVLFSVIRGSFYTPILFVFSMPIFAKFVFKSKFDLRVLFFCYALVCIVFANAAIHNALDDFMSCSRNYVSVKLLFISTLLTLIIFKQKGKILLFPSIITLVFSLLAIGRGGILCSTLNFLGLFYIRINEIIKHQNMKFVIFMFMGIMFFAFSEEIQFLYETSESFERINEMGFEDNAREVLWEEYVSKIDLRSLFTGYDLSECKDIHSFNDNPHNSYIHLHSYLGIFAILFFGIVLYALIWSLRMKSYIYAIPLFALLLRGYTDTIFLSYYDCVIVYILLCILNAKQMKMEL